MFKIINADEIQPTNSRHPGYMSPRRKQLLEAMQALEIGQGFNVPNDFYTPGTVRTNTHYLAKLINKDLHKGEKKRHFSTRTCDGYIQVVRDA
jgi:hypothetical protein